MLSGHEIRERFLNFFKEREHTIIDSASLVTNQSSDITNATLFNTAGMQPLIPYLLGEEHSGGVRLASSQKCVRTGDLEEVGDNTHLTFFEMLGNWSLGDYFKKEAIAWSWEFLTNPETGLGLDPNRLYVTVFAGNDQVPRDDEAVEIWKQFVPENRIYFYDSKNNWWTAGPDSPAGPSTEMFYDVVGDLGDMTQEEFEKADENQKVVEIWNDVFMAYRQEGGEVVGELPNKNVDTGAGLERVSAVVQGVSNVFETDLFVPLMNIIRETSGLYNERDARIIADHVKTAVFLIVDGVKPSNTGRGYVLRRILRRAYSSINRIQLNDSSILILINEVIDMYKDSYFTELGEEVAKDNIEIIDQEIQKISKIYTRAHQMFKEMGWRDEKIDGEKLAYLEQSEGIPFEVSKTMADKYNVKLSPTAEEEYEMLKKEHQDKSRTSAAGKFKGGLVGDSQKIRALHTATHLMLAGLQKYLGSEVQQKGSNITEDRIRFDFNYDGKVEQEILDQVEDYVNQAISNGANVDIALLDKDAAQSDPNITGSFWERYPETVQVYQITAPDGTVYSQELCGGPHVQNTSEIDEFGTFKIVKESSSSAGVRRIKAILE